MYSTRTAIVTMVYVDTLTRGVGGRVVIRVQYAYCHTVVRIFRQVGWNGSAWTLCVWLDVLKAMAWTIHVLPEYLWSQCWMTDLTWQCWTWLGFLYSNYVKKTFNIVSKYGIGVWMGDMQWK